MHPILGSARRLAIYLLAWLLIGLLLSVGLGVRDGQMAHGPVFFVRSRFFGLISSGRRKSAGYSRSSEADLAVAPPRFVAAVFARALWVGRRVHGRGRRCRWLGRPARSVSNSARCYSSLARIVGLGPFFYLLSRSTNRRTRARECRAESAGA